MHVGFNFVVFEDFAPSSHNSIPSNKLFVKGSLAGNRACYTSGAAAGIIDSRRNCCWNVQPY